MRRSLFAVFFAASCFAGCAVQSQEEPNDGVTDSSEDALALASLYGTWIGDGGKFYEITFSKDAAETLGGGLKGRRFDAKIDTGVRCIAAPCDAATLEASGVYKLSHGTSLTLASYDRPSLEFSKVLGDYSVKVSKGVLTLTKKDGSFKETFHQAPPSTGTKCGTAVCGEGQYCCNPLNSQCVKIGYMCTL